MIVLHATDLWFPILIEITQPHGLEPGVTPGKDYDKYLIIKDFEDFPIGTSFKVLQYNFTGKSVNEIIA